MLRRLVATATLLPLALLTPAPAPADDFDEVFLAAACTPYLGGGPGRVAGVFVRTPEGVAVQHPPGATQDVTLFCNIDLDVTNYFNFFQVIAEDNDPTAHVTATLYQESLDGSAAPVAIATVTTSDQPGVQQAHVDLDNSFSEIPHHFYIEVTLHRESASDVVRVYSTGIRDVL
jgi:hypothetical protein